MQMHLPHLARADGMTVNWLVNRKFMIAGWIMGTIIYLIFVMP